MIFLLILANNYSSFNTLFNSFKFARSLPAPSMHAFGASSEIIIGKFNVVLKYLSRPTMPENPPVINIPFFATSALISGGRMFNVVSTILLVSFYIF